MKRLAYALLLALLLVACSETPTPPANPQPQPEQPNSAPTVRLSASSMSGEAKFEVSFTASAADPDGDTLSYRWTVDGEPLDAYSSSLGLTFSKAGSYQVGVTVSDSTTTVSDVLIVTARDELRPVDAPDVLIFGFAGRCGFYPQCSAPAENTSYLDGESETLQALERTFQDLGYTVGSLSFRANLTAHDVNGFGYQDAEAALAHIHDTWIRDYQDPTRVVLVAHSHGNQFMSLLAMDHPEVTFDYAIYLDAVCLRWDKDHTKSGLFASTYGTQANWPRPLNTLGRACDTFKVPGLSLQDISDVVPSNVRYAFEVRSVGMPLPSPLPQVGPVYDDDINHRPDGSRTNLSGIHESGETHTRVDDGNSAAMRWVTNNILARGLPEVGLAGQAAESFEPLPAPEGFELD